MSLSLVLAMTLAAPPAGGPVVDRDPSGRWVSIRGLDTGPLGATPEEAARAFVSGYAGELGLGPGQELALRHAPAAGEAGVVQLERRIGGLPVFGGGVSLTVDEGGAVQAAFASGGPFTTAGSFRLSRAEAVDAAVAALGGPDRVRLPGAVVQGWWPGGETLRAAYRVDLAITRPAGEWRALVDAADGSLLFAQDLRHTAQGRVYDYSPAEQSDGSLCAGSPPGSCASTALHNVVNLKTGATTLDGAQFHVYNCRKSDYPTAAGSTAACVDVAQASGNYDFAPDPLGGSGNDDFAAVMAYYHLDQHFTFLKTLDTSPASQAKLVPLATFVNATDAGAAGSPPLENAFYSGGLQAMVFGQGASVNYAYDASVMYHELTHGAVDDWGGFDPGLGSDGALEDTGSANEGTADSLAASHTGLGRVGAYALNPYRNLANMKTCRGSGTFLTQFGFNGLVDGMDGEVHDDGEIWNGFYWEVREGLRAAGVKGCSGTCDAAAQILYRTIETAAGHLFDLAGYTSTFQAQAAALFGAGSGVDNYVQCVAARHSMAGCDRTVPLYANEAKAAFIRFRYAPLQIVVQASAAAVVELCMLQGQPAKAYFRSGQKVRLVSPALSGATTLDTSAPVTSTIDVTAQCPATDAVNVPAGTWYVLFDQSLAVPGNGIDVGIVVTNATGMAARPGITAPAACVYTPGSGGGSTGGSTSSSSKKSCGCGGGPASGLALLPLALLRLRRRRAA